MDSLPLVKIIPLNFIPDIIRYKFLTIKNNLSLDDITLLSTFLKTLINDANFDQSFLKLETYLQDIVLHMIKEGTILYLRLYITQSDYFDISLTKSLT